MYITYIEVEEHSMKSVNDAVKMGLKFSADARMEEELDRRIGIAKSALGALKRNVVGCRELSGKANIHMEVYNAMCGGGNDDVWV